MTLDAALRLARWDAVQEALRRHGGRRKPAAHELGISRRHLVRILAAGPPDTTELEPEPAPPRLRAEEYEAALRERVLIRDGARCGICGDPVPAEELEFDHIMPLSRGGSNRADNRQVAHSRCNRLKGNRIP